MNWPLWGGLLAVLLLSKHVWVMFAPAEHAVPASAFTTQSAQTEQLFGTVVVTKSTASLNGIQPIGIFASVKHGFAVLQTESGQVGVGLGELVIPGVRLVETHADHVVLESNGVRQSVDLVKTHEASNGGAPFRGNPISAAPPQPQPTSISSGGAASNSKPPSGLDQLTPEQRKEVAQQQRDLKRSRH